MRIVHVVEYFHSMLGYQELFLAKEHVKAGHDVYVVTSDRYHSSIYTRSMAVLIGSRVKGAGFFNESGIQVWRLKTRIELPNIIWVAGLEGKIRELKPDLVIMHGVTNLTAVRIARMKKKTGGFKLVFDDHAIPENTTGKMRVLYPLFRWTFSRPVQKAADALVAIVPETKAFMNRKYGIPLERITVIPLGADTGLFRFDADARLEVRKELGVKEDDTVFIYASKIIPSRYLSVFIEATGRLLVTHEKIKVLMIGSGEEQYISEMKQDVRTRELERIFVWLGAVSNEQLYRYYSAADVSVWPFGPSIGMREAMSCRLPIIIGENSRVTELVENNNGLLFREGDASDLARQMEKLLDPELRKEMGNNGRALVEEKLSWEKIAERFIELVSETG